MLKKISTFILILSALAYLYFNVSVPLNFLRAPLRKALVESPLKGASFQRVSFKFFNRISVEGIEFTDSFRCKELSVFVNPLLLAKYYRTPEKAVYGVAIDGADVIVSDALKKILIERASRAGFSSSSIKQIALKNCNFKYSNYLFSRVRGTVSLEGGYRAKLSFRLKDRKVRLETAVSDVKGLYRGEVRADVAGNKLEAKLQSVFFQPGPGAFNATVRIPKFSFHDISAADSVAKVRYSGAGFFLRLLNRAGTAQIEGTNEKNFKISLNMVLDSIVKGVAGKIDTRIERTPKTLNGYLNAAKLYYKNSLLGNLSFAVKTSPKGTVIGKGDVSPAGYTFELVAEPGKGFAIKGSCRQKGPSINVRGMLFPLNAAINVSKWPLKDMPVLSNLYNGIKGSLSVLGNIDKNKNVFSISADNLVYRDSRPTSFSAHVVQTKAGLFYKLKSLDESILLTGRALNSGQWDISGVLRNALLKNYSVWANSPVTLDGSVSGQFFMDSSRNGFLKAKIDKLVISDYFNGSAQIAASFSPDSLDINYFSLHSLKGTATGSVSVGLNPYWGSSSANITFFKFPFRGNTVGGRIALKGTLFNDERFHFAGGLEGNDIKVGNWKAKGLRTMVDLSSNGVQLKNLVIDDYLSGDIGLLFESRVIGGIVYLNSFPLRYLSADIDGPLNGTLSLKKTLDNPEIALSYSVQGARYKNYVFNSSAKLNYKNKNLTGEKIYVSSGTSALFLDGSIWPELRLKGKVDYLSVALIQNLLEKEIPFTGGFAGQIAISNSLKDPRIGADIRAIGLYYNDVAIPEFVASVFYQAGTVNIEKFYTKYEDSEVRISGGSYVSVKDNKFSVKSELRNCRGGPFCIFGKLSLSGEFYQKEKKYGIKGLAEARDMWLNQRSLTSVKLGFDLFGSNITFGSYAKHPSIATGSVDLGKWPKVKFQDFRLGERLRYFQIDGSVDPKKSDFSVHTKKLPGDILTDILELPLSVQGSVDSAIAAKGSIDNPSILGNITVSTGSLSEMSFNKLAVNFNIADDVLKIFNSGVAQKDKNTVTLEGSVPFFLTKAARKRVMSKKIALTLSIEKGSLAVFNGLTQDINFVKGDLEAKLNLTGTLLKPTWNGLLKVTGGELDSKQFVKKVKDLNIELTLKNNVLKVVECSGKVGSGIPRLTGTVIFEGFIPQKFNLHFKTEGNNGIPVSIPTLPIPTPLVKTNEESVFSNLSHGEPRADLRIHGPLQKLKLSGWIELENTRFTYPSLLKSEPSEGFMDAVWPMIKLDVEFRSGKNTWYDNELASVNVAGSIKLTGRADDITVNGKIEGLHGAIQYFGAEFDVRSALLEIVNDTVYLQAEATNETYVSNETIPDIITMTIDRAEISKIKPHFSSKDNQSLSSEKALARATKMDPALYEGQDENFIMQRQIIRVIDSSLATPIARNILKKSGLVDTFNVHYVEKSEAAPANPNQPSLTDLLYGTKYSVEKYITNQVKFGYSLIFDRMQDQERLGLRHELDLSYKWTKNIFVTGSYQLDNKDLATEAEKKISIAEIFRFGGPKNKKKEIKKAGKKPAKEKQKEKE